MHAPLEPLEAGLTRVIECHQLSVEHCFTHPESPEQSSDLRVGVGDLPQVPALEPQASWLHVGDGPHPVPLDLERKVGFGLWDRRRGAGEHRHDPLRHWLPAGVGRRVHAVDHPVVLGPLVAPDHEQAVAAREPLAVKRHLHLVLGPLLGLERAAVPDPHRPRAILPPGDLALELEVLHRMILGAHREPVLARVGRDPIRDRPGGKRSIVLKPKVPVKPRGVVLLDDEAAPGGCPLPCGGVLLGLRSLACRSVRLSSR